MRFILFYFLYITIIMADEFEELRYYINIYGKSLMAIRANQMLKNLGIPCKYLGFNNDESERIINAEHALLYNEKYKKLELPPKYDDAMEETIYEQDNEVNLTTNPVPEWKIKKFCREKTLYLSFYIDGVCKLLTFGYAFRDNSFKTKQESKVKNQTIGEGEINCRRIDSSFIITRMCSFNEEIKEDHKFNLKFFYIILEAISLCRVIFLKDTFLLEDFNEIPPDSIFIKQDNNNNNKLIGGILRRQKRRQQRNKTTVKRRKKKSKRRRHI